MSDEVAIQIHLDVEGETERKERIRTSLEDACRTLGREFPEITHLEVTLAPDGVGYQASGHVTGKGTEVAGHAQATEPEPAADKLVDTLRHQLRRTHDKRIFARRRDAQKNHPRRS